MDIYLEAIEKFSEVYQRAQACGLKEPSAMTLATSSPDGRPSVRTVLLKGFDKHGFVFFTNHESRKAQQLTGNPQAALAFHWQPLEEQVLMEGTVTTVTAKEADAYWKTRPRESQLGAWASLQSRPLEHRKTLEDRFAEFEKKYAKGSVPRPAWWSGFRLMPSRIEFWKAAPFRLHHRTLYENQGKGWKRTLLFP